MAKKLTIASPEYVKLVNEVASTKAIGNFVEFQVYNIRRSKKEVIKVQKASELVELALEKEDVVVISIYEEAFDLQTDEVKRLWIENAINQVRYDSEKDKFIIGDEPTIVVDLGMYRKYGDTLIKTLELQALTLQQIADAEKQKKADEKAARKAKSKK